MPADPEAGTATVDTDSGAGEPPPAPAVDASPAGPLLEVAVQAVSETAKSKEPTLIQLPSGDQAVTIAWKRVDALPDERLAGAKDDRLAIGDVFELTATPKTPGGMFKWRLPDDGTIVLADSGPALKGAPPPSAGPSPDDALTQATIRVKSGCKNYDKVLEGAGAPEVAVEYSIGGGTEKATLKVPVGLDPPDGTATPWFAPSRPVRSGNKVTAYITGEATFGAIGAALSAAGPGDFFYVGGWACGIDTPLSGVSLVEALSNASDRKVEIRALFWDHQVAYGLTALGEGVVAGALLAFNGAEFDDPKGGTTPVKIKTGLAIADGQVNGVAGALHQKIQLVRNGPELKAFSGGIDIHSSRLGEEPYSFHDVHCQVEGPAAEDLLETFVSRWQKQPSEKRTLGLFNNDVPKQKAKSNLYAQVCRTFAPDPAEKSIIEAIRTAIRRTKRFIYLEDQYTASMDVATELAKKIAEPQFELLVILTPSFDQIADAGFGGELGRFAHRKRFFETLLEAGGDKVAIAHRTNYVHSKTWIFDDKFAIIGSANCCARSYFNDGEQSVGVFDPNVTGKYYFAHRLRMDLWQKHLGAPPAELVDPVAAAKYWRQPWGKVSPIDLGVLATIKEIGSELSSGVKSYLATGYSFLPGTGKTWEDIVDPGGETY